MAGKLTDTGSQWVEVHSERTLLAVRRRNVILVDVGVPDNATLLLRLSPGVPPRTRTAGRQ